MNWMQSLYETYENCQTSIGYSHGASRPLLPICHITVQAHIEVVIDGNGNFRRARIVNKDEATTIIPATEESAGSKTGTKPVNHPLSDRLQYLAGDFVDYGGVVTSGFSKDPEEPYRNFVDLLTRWCQSPYSHPKARAILAYVQKKTLIYDLAAQNILLVGDDDKLLEKKAVKREKNTKDIFSVVNPQGNAVVRWVVESPESDEHRTWLDKTLWESWSSFYLTTRKDDNGICLVTGENKILTTSHPKYIRREGDGAKLISANDTSGFTFRGRFLSDDQALGVGLETSQKAHYALSWLLSRQGFISGDLAIVAWATSGASVIQPTDDPVDAWDDDASSENVSDAYTAQEVALSLKKKIAGYRQELGDTAQMIVMAVDSATPGRLSIVYYRALTSSDFLDRIEHWHESAAWYHTYHYDKAQKRYIHFIGAPSPAAIAEAAYGNRIDNNLKNTTIKRLLPCIIEGQPVPFDLVESTVRRASNRAGLGNWEWEKVLSIACSLYRKFKEKKETYDMSLDETRTTRDYLYGRLLALADNLESWALRDADEKRETTAARLMQRFAEHPFSTWRQIELALRPYIARLGGKSIYLQREIDKVVDLFDPQDFIKDTRLSGEFLLGYHSQRQALWSNRSTQTESKES